MGNRMNRPGAGDGDDDSDTERGNRRVRPDAPRLPKQFNSDWNTVVEEKDTNLFFNIFSAPQLAAKDARLGSNTILTKNKEKVKRQIQLQLGQPKKTVKEKAHLDKVMTGESDAGGPEAQINTHTADKEFSRYDESIQSSRSARDKEMAEINDGDEEEKKDPFVRAVLDSLDGDKEETKENQEESKAAANQRLKDHRMFEFLCTTKYSEFYQRLIPNKLFKTISVDEARVYGGRFTQKGNLYYCSSQESIILYDTRDPYNWTLKSKIDAQRVQWTVSDMDVSPDEQYMVYSSMDPFVRLVDLDTLRRKQEFLDLSASRDQHFGFGGSMSIMSLKLSGDGKEVLCGTKGAILMVYDLVANRMVTKVGGCHTDEINSVCFANRQHSNIIFSGSDDGMVKVWDRRALSSNRPAGVFVGHAEGITNVASKGDGIYLASNGKDQLLKVWDIRQAISFDKLKGMQLPQQDPGFDYRYGTKYRLLDRQPKHFADKSVFTFKGHAVYSTLIRCQFSPLETTGQRYVYTGSSDGNLHIYDLVTGETAGVLRKAPPRTSADYYGYGNASPARDISWHPFMPVLASTEFTGAVNIWSMQNIGEEERQKMAQQNSAKAKLSQNVGSDEAGEEDEGQEDESSDPFSNLGAGSQYVMVRGAGGQVYRVPIGMLRQLMNTDEAGEDENVEEDVPSPEEDAGADKNLESGSIQDLNSQSQPKVADPNDELYEEEKKEEAPRENADMQDWDMDDVSWGEENLADSLDHKPAAKEVESISGEDEEDHKMTPEDTPAVDEAYSAVFNGQSSEHSAVKPQLNSSDDEYQDCN